MSQNTPLNPPPSRAHVSPDRCPLCLGAGDLPSMTTAWVRLPCPRCVDARMSAKPDAPGGCAHGGPPMALAEVAQAEWHPDDRVPTPGYLLLLVGIAIGAVGAALVVGIFRMFGS